MRRSLAFVVAVGGLASLLVAQPEGPVLADEPSSILDATGRILETRSGTPTIDGQFEGIGARAAFSTTPVTVLGRAGVPTDAAAALLNVTVTNPQTAGFLTVYPCGQDRPNASSLNFTPGQTIANAVTTRIGTNGQVCVYTMSTTDIIIDVTGAYPASTSFTSFVPGRILETRPGYTTVDGLAAGIGARLPGSTTVLAVGGRAGVPTDASAAVLNVTVTNPQTAGFVTVYPCGQRPNASSLNFGPGQTIANAVTTRIEGGQICVYTMSTTDIIVDVTGAYPASTSFTSFVPGRILETRAGYTTVDGQFAGVGARAAFSTTPVTVLGRAGVSTDSLAAVFNVTVTNPQTSGFVTVYPCGQDRPYVSSVNFTPGQTIANAVTTRIGTNGQVCIYTMSTTDIIIDVTGTFSGGVNSLPGALRFGLTGATGLALKSSASISASRYGSAVGQSATGSNLLAVNAAGQTQDAVISGAANVGAFLIAPNNKLYVIFQSKTNLTNTTVPGDCLLAEVDPASGNPKCIENSVDYIENKSKTGNPGGWEGNPTIQFDSSGAIYYVGRNSNGNVRLRKYAAGTATDLINDNIYLNDWLVLPDGRVIITGSTTSTNAQWVRRISSAGGLKTLASGATSNFMRIFPDGNVYLGLWNTGNLGVRRYLTNLDQVETKYWINSSNGSEVGAEWYNNALPFCDDNTKLTTNAAFCGSYGSYATQVFRTTDGNAFAVAGWGASGLLMQYFPTLAKPVTSVIKVSASQPILTNVVLAGLNAANENILTLYNTSNSVETTLIGSSNEIEIYRINYVASTNRIMFDGLRFADNKYVIGQVDLNTMTVSASQTGTGKLVDFQTFAQ
jgi:hypothetical protein